MTFIALTPLAGFEALKKQMVSQSLIWSICSAMDFSFVMKITKCDKYLVNTLAKGIIKCRPLLISGVVIYTFLINIFLTSAAGVTAAVGAVFIPLLISTGVHPAIAGAAVTFIKKNKGYVDINNSAINENFKPNYFYTILPLFPVIMLVVCSLDSVRAAYPWAKDISAPYAMLMGSILYIIVTRTNPAKTTTKFFDGMSKAYGDILCIIIAAAVFVAGMKSLNLIDAFIELLKSSENIAAVASTYGPFLLAIILGLRDAAAIAFNQSVTPHDQSFGFEIVNMGSLAALAGARRRTASSIAGATIIASSIAKADPVEIAKRTTHGAIIASTIAMIGLLFI